MREHLFAKTTNLYTRFRFLLSRKPKVLAYKKVQRLVQKKQHKKELIESLNLMKQKQATVSYSSIQLIKKSMEYKQFNVNGD